MAVTINASTSAGLINTADTSGILQLQTANTTALTIDASQNVGVGVTPSAWIGYKVLQAGIASFAGGSSGAYLLQDNAFTDNSGAGWKYINSGYAAAQYYAASGAHVWRTAASGTAGNAISFTQAMTLDASGNLGVGTTSASQRLHIAKNGTLGIRLDNQATNYWDIENNSNLVFSRGGSEFARIDSSGNLLVGNTSYNNANKGILLSNNGRLYATCDANPVGSFNRLTNDGTCINFYRSSSEVGYVSVTTTSTTYATSSDYRLKNTIAPMTGALAKVAQLKPVTYKWNADGSDGEGFIAHELAEVCPQAVTGEKNAVDEDGNPKYQGIDTSFLVATLTAALQEAVAKINSLEARLDAANL